MDRFKNYTIICLFAIIAVLLLLRQCGDGGTSNGTIIKGTHVSDTLTVHDTIRAVDTIITTKWLKSPKIIQETPISIIDTSLFKNRTYADSVEDDNQTLYYTAKVVGRLDSMKMDYKLKIPLIINNTTTINTLRVDTLIRPSKWSLYAGAEVGGNATQFNASPYVTLNVKKATVTYRYGLLDKSHSVGIGFRLLKSKR